MKNIKKICLISVSIIAFCLVAVFGGAIYLVNYALSPVKPSASLDNTPLELIKDIYEPDVSVDKKNSSDPVEIYYQNYTAECYEKIRKIAETVQTTSFDGLKLKGFELAAPKNSHNWAITLHGYHAGTKSMAAHALHFYNEGFNVILPGQRGHGWSEGKITDMGTFACQDLVSWANYIVEKDPEAKIVILGVSMGAATVMLSSPLDYPENVNCLIADCGYSSVWEQFVYRMGVEFHLPAFPLLNTASAISSALYGIDFKKVSPAEAVSRSKLPVLFIHGDADDYVPFSMFHKVYDSAECPKDSLIIPGAKHARAVFVDPESYWKKVSEFLTIYWTN